MSDLDALIDTLVSDAQIETGTSAEWLQERGMIARPRIQELPAGRKRVKQPYWTEEEEQFYLDHVSSMRLEEIAQALGRSEHAVKCHRFRKGLPSHRRTPGYLTTHQVAVLLGIDSHAPPIWVDHGIMPGELVPLDNMKMRRVRLEDFKRWLVRPESWVYFKVERIKNPSLQRLVRLAQERWGDEWWSTRQAADFLGLDPKDIERQIRLGKIRGIQAKLLGGRDFIQGWALWFVRKSEAAQIKIRRNGSTEPSGRDGWSPRANAYILQARAEGMEYQGIAARMKWKQKRVEYRAKRLIEQMTRVEEGRPADGEECWVRDDRRHVFNAIYTDAGWLIFVKNSAEPGKIVAWMRKDRGTEHENKNGV